MIRILLDADALDGRTPDDLARSRAHSGASFEDEMPGRVPDHVPGRVVLQGVALDAGEQHHLRVRRVAAGEMVEVRDGRGLVGRGRLVHEGKRWSVDLLAVEMAAAPPPLTLAVGAGDRERFSWLVEKAAEIGVTGIIPLVTSRSQAVASKLQPAQIDRLRRRALDAIKQSGAAWAPTLDPPMALDAFTAAPHPGHRWLADVAGEAPPAMLDDAPVTVAVGPEGGLDDAERESLLTHGFVPVALGPHIFRFETAALAGALAVIGARQRHKRGM